MQKSLSFSVVNEFKYFSSKDEYGSLRVLTKMQARRMSSIAKKIVDIALFTTSEQKIDFIVYSSRHGEVLTSIKLIESLKKGEELSPTLFSQSTHNSAIGQFCILAKKEIPMTSISAGKDSWNMGILSVVRFLKSHPGTKVLFVYADVKAPELYHFSEKEINDEQIYCSIVTEGNDYFFDLKSWKSDLVL